MAVFRIVAPGNCSPLETSVKTFPFIGKYFLNQLHGADVIVFGAALNNTVYRFL